MTVRIHLQIVGALLLSLGIAHAFFDRYFGWKEELAAVSTLTRRIFQVHCFFIALMLLLLGAGSLFYVDALLERSRLSRAVLAGTVVFWLCRLIVQFLVYDSAVWSGSRFYTFMHAVFCLLWIYVVTVYSAALRSVWLAP